ncbi:NAD(P)H-hydrate dehydratase [Vibrio astriarenae]
MDDFTYLYTSEQIKSAERCIASDNGFPLFDLMVKAGRAVFDLACLTYPDKKHWLVVCGKGNNGGDGYIVATLALQAGITTTVYEMAGCEHNQGDAFKARQGFLAAGGTPKSMHDGSELANDKQASFDLVFDALLGTGLKGELRAECINVIHEINKRNLAVIAIDVPSGLNADTGKVEGDKGKPTAVIARHTISFIGVKTGLVTGQARHHVGRLHLARLGISEQDLTHYQEPACRADLCANAAKWMSPRAATAHKGSAGKLLVFGGAAGMLGATRLATNAALRAGAGLVKACVDEASLSPLQAAEREVMAVSWQAAKPNLAWCDVIVLGPGLGQSSLAHSICEFAISQRDKPMVVDADGLNYLAQYSQFKSTDRRDNWILTPHPGEAARLLHCSVSHIESDRYAAIKAIQQRYGGAVVLKGAGTLIFDGQTCYVCTRGNAGMATGGMGDVLSGVVGSYLAQGYTPTQAALMGVLLHSMAADNCIKESGMIGLLASELLPEIRRLTNYFAQR